MKSIKNLFLSITLLASFAGVRAMDNNNTLTINPLVNLNVQTLLSPEIIKLYHAANLAQTIISQNVNTEIPNTILNFTTNVTNTMNNLVNTLNISEETQNALVGIKDIVNMLINHGNPFSEEEIEQAQTMQQQLENNPLIIQAIGLLNILVNDDTISNDYNFIINTAGTLVNTNNQE